MINDNDSLEKEIQSYEREDIVEAQKTLNQLLKTSKLGYTTFDKLLFGLIDTYAAQPETAQYQTEKTNSCYKRVITFCADRLLATNKKRVTVKALKDITAQYSSRDQWVKDATIYRIDNYISVGTHQFTAYKAEYEANYTQRLAQTEDALKYYNSELITQKQKKLTSFVNGITNELVNDKLAVLLNRSDLETVKEAVAIIDNVKQTVIHTKEVKKRTEKRREAEEKSILFACENAVKNECKLDTLPLNDLVNLAIHYSSVDEKYRDTFEYLLNLNHIFSEIERCHVDTKRFAWFKRELAENLNTGLIYMVRRMSWRYGLDSEYTKIKAPKIALSEYLQEWKTNHFDKINTRFDKQLTLINTIQRDFEATKKAAL